MRIRSTVLFVTCVFFGFTGSTPLFGQKLYDVRPTASQRPAVFVAHQKRVIVGTGGWFKYLESWTGPGGEVFSGKFEKITATAVNVPATGQVAPPQSNLAFAWDAVYGQGYFVAHILGEEIEQGVFTGDKGTVLQVEWSLSGIPDQVYVQGVAIDNKGNIYKGVD